MIDLHIHTSASADAQHSPAEIFALSKERGLRCIAFADHNTAAAVGAGLLLARNTGIDFITGMELNTELDGCDVHLLGYGFDLHNPGLQSWLGQIEQMYWAVAAQRVERFIELGLELTLAQVREKAGGKLPTGSSFLDALIETPANRHHPLIQPYGASPRAQNRYVNFYFEVMSGGGPAAMPESSLPLLPAIGKFLSIGALPVVAHPRDLPEPALRRMIDAGLLGIEVFCSYHDRETTRRWSQLAQKYHLLVTAGSDFHGRQFKPTVPLGGLEGAGRDLVEKLQAAIAARR